ncbi:hypothetical protein GCM10023157_10830 [Gluconacetobacter asukensis]
MWRVSHAKGLMDGGKFDLLPEWEKQTLAGVVLNLLDRQKSGDVSSSEILDFFAFCQENILFSSAQIYQDLWVLLMTNKKRNGFFVEFGACDGVFLSNTLLLEKEYGWNGILAEPNPIWFDKLTNNRNCILDHSCVYSRSGENIKMLCVTEQPELSRIVSVVPQDVHEHDGNRADAQISYVDTISLNDLLVKHSAPSTIDYLSIDTEGSEFEILNSFHFDKCDVRLITVEHAGEEEKRNKIRSLLEKNNFERWHPELSRWDDWYVKIDGKENIGMLG